MSAIVVFQNEANNREARVLIKDEELNPYHSLLQKCYCLRNIAEYVKYYDYGIKQDKTKDIRV